MRGALEGWVCWGAAGIVGLLLVGCPAGVTDDDDDAGPTESVSPVVINEFMAANIQTVVDDSGETPDWVELYNPSDEDWAVGGYHLTDELADPLRHRLADGLVVPAGGHLLLIADGEPTRGEEHLGFRLDQGGEQLGLSDDAGLAVDAVEFPEQLPDWSTRRLPDGGETWDVTWRITPGAENGGS
jgi:hypothetical protein